MKGVFRSLIFIFSCACIVSAQTITDDEDWQSWNDVQLTAPMSKHFDFFTAVTMRFGRNVSRLNDGRFHIGVIWKPTKSFSLMPFYMNGQARDARSRFRQEHRFTLRATYRFPTKGFGLTHRGAYEYRKRPTGNTHRYRGMLTFEKDLPENFLSDAKFFVSDEIFYDSGTGKFSRNRFSTGITKTFTKNLSLDLYYMRQNDGYSRPGDLNIIGTSWKVKL